MRTKTVLKRAHKLIEEPGSWIQYHDYRYKNGKLAFCMRGAVLAATSKRFERERAMSALIDVVGSPTTFNDDPYRTQAEVLAAFDHAIKSL